MNSTAAADRVGISYRQFNFWVIQGYIKGGHPGQGFPRDISHEEFAVLRHMAALVQAGVTAKDAAPLARRLAAGESVKFGPWALAPLAGSV